jgi:CIC family chloride channel protein
MRAKDHKSAPAEEDCWDLIRTGTYIDGNATLEQAMPVFESTGQTYLPVVTLGDEETPPELWGVLFQVDALRAMNKALAETAAEEHS